MIFLFLRDIPYMSGEIIYFGVAGDGEAPQQGEAFPKPLARDQNGNRPIYPGELSGIAYGEDLVHKHLLCTSAAFTLVHPPPPHSLRIRTERKRQLPPAFPSRNQTLLYCGCRLPSAGEPRKPSKFRAAMIPTEQIGMFLCPPVWTSGSYLQTACGSELIHHGNHYLSRTILSFLPSGCDIIGAKDENAHFSAVTFGLVLPGRHSPR